MADDALVPAICLDQAQSLIASKAKKFRRASATLKYHPFAAFTYGLYRRSLGIGRMDKRHTLVDIYSGKAFFSYPWANHVEERELEDDQKVRDPKWNSINYEQARACSDRLVATANLRRFRLMGHPRVEVQDSRALLWKPNWILAGMIEDRAIRVLVDGMTGEFYVVGS